MGEASVTGLEGTQGDMRVTVTNSPKADIALEISHDCLAEGVTPNPVEKWSHYRQHLWDTRSDDKHNLFVLGL